MHGIVVFNFRRTRVSVLQERPFACLLNVSKHKYLLFIIVKLAFHSWWTLSQEYSRFNQLKEGLLSVCTPCNTCKEYTV